MENWITRIVATLCAAGGIALFWTFGAFVAVPWHKGRMLSLSWIELQLIGIPLAVGFAVMWGAIHIFSIADRGVNPKIYATIRALLSIAAIAAMIGGVTWALTRIT